MASEAVEVDLTCLWEGRAGGFNAKFKVYALLKTSIFTLFLQESEASSNFIKKSQFTDNKLRLSVWRHHHSAGPEWKSQIIDLLKKIAIIAIIAKIVKIANYAVPLQPHITQDNDK